MIKLSGIRINPGEWLIHHTGTHYARVLCNDLVRPQYPEPYVLAVRKPVYVNGKIYINETPERFTRGQLVEEYGWPQEGDYQGYSLTYAGKKHQVYDCRDEDGSCEVK